MARGVRSFDGKFSYHSSPICFGSVSLKLWREPVQSVEQEDETKFYGTSASSEPRSDECSTRLSPYHLS